MKPPAFLLRRCLTFGTCCSLALLLSSVSFAVTDATKSAQPKEQPSAAQGGGKLKTSSSEQRVESPQAPEKETDQEVTPEAAGSLKQKKDPCRKGFMGLRKRPQYCAENSRELEYAFLPGVFTQKETSLGFAIYNEMTFHADKKELTQPSRLSLSFAYTLRKQYLIKLQSFLNFDENNWIIEGFADFRVYPNRYYGIGNNTPWTYQVYSENALSFFYEVRRRILGPLYLGLVWDLRSAFKFDEGDTVDEKTDEDLEQAGPLVVDDPLGSEKNLNHGFGLEVVFDTRDDFYEPHDGGLYKSWVNFYGPQFGGDFRYLNWQTDLRQYIPTFGKQVLALQFVGEFRFGEVPFSSLAEFGGPWRMRGYFKGRYRDRHLLIAQAEYRFPIYKRLSGVGFADIGEVFGSTRFSAKRLRWTAGGGLRFRFGDRTFIRLDFGGNGETSATIFNGGHAF